MALPEAKSIPTASTSAKIQTIPFDDELIFEIFRSMTENRFSGYSSLIQSAIVFAAIGTTTIAKSGIIRLV
jgi:hypothetical protein